MSPTFADLIGRLRAGDHEAAAELVRQYESTVRRVIRLRLGDARLQAAFDSMDICQSVLASFFVRTAAGQYELQSAEDLVKLLAAMARKKLASQVRKERRQRRDNRRVRSMDAVEEELAAGAASPSRHMAASELWQNVQQHLTEEERRLVELRSQGRQWSEIAAELEQNEVALRKKLSRALDRVARELGVDAETP